ncbi:MAG: hypothetical protein QM773_09365 [Hyphomonadaceae bacterium]
MIRYLTIAALLASASPALAQPCKITRKDGGLESFASATINGIAANSVLYWQGPRLFDLKIDPAAKALGYTFKDNGKAGLYIYRTGKSVDGKDWMQPGSVATDMAGFDIDWPRFFLKKDMVKSIGVELKVDKEMGERDVITKLKDGQARDGFARPLDFAFSSPRKLYWFSEGGDEDEEIEIEDAWRAAISPGKQMVVDFYDATLNFYNNKLAKTKIATATLTFPADEVFQTRYVADFTALRKAFTEKRCEAPK